MVLPQGEVISLSHFCTPTTLGAPFPRQAGSTDSLPPRAPAQPPPFGEMVLAGPQEDKAIRDLSFQTAALPGGLRSSRPHEAASAQPREAPSPPADSEPGSVGKGHPPQCLGSRADSSAVGRVGTRLPFTMGDWRMPCMLGSFYASSNLRDQSSLLPGSRGSQTSCELHSAPQPVQGEWGTHVFSGKVL